MIQSSNAIEGAAVCGVCECSLLVKRYVQPAEGSTFFDILCSPECFRVAARNQRRVRWTARRRYLRRLTLGIMFAGAYLTPHQGPAKIRPVRLTPVQTTRNLGPPPLPAGWFGPEWPPTERDILATLGRDAWIHPLSGPIRRMPRSDSRVFGAARPGDRAVECRNGHCGVDLGGELWGEHVHAVHDGVVDWVRRGVNPDRGGQFVRLSHYNGTVFTQYFHLAAIPRALERGTPVKGGEVIGLLGDTGVKESGPHLHFALSIRAAKDGPERYVDPEPLIALWPLRVPLDGSEAGLVTTVARPGLPHGSAPLMAGRKRRQGRHERAADDATDDAKNSPANNNATPAGGEPASGTGTDDDEPKPTEEE